MRPIDKILAAKREEIASNKAAESIDEVKSRAKDAAPVRDFFSALNLSGQLALIAEVKRSSPSKGKIADFDVAELTKIYDNSPAAAISVLTDSHFEGEIEHLRTARKITEKPILRKDFILDEYQIYQARAFGADAVLLISSILDAKTLSGLLAVCNETGVHALVESHSKDDVARIPQEAAIYGINNRDLNSQDLAIDMNTTENVISAIPDGKTIVCESGLLEREDIQRTKEIGRVNAVLIGTALLASGDPAAKIAELMGG